MGKQIEINTLSNDKITDFGKGITFKSIDGKEWATFEDAQVHNQFLENLMYQKIEEQDDFGYIKGKTR